MSAGQNHSKKHHEIAAVQMDVHHPYNHYYVSLKVAQSDPFDAQSERETLGPK